jgi:hypothetical protein
MFARVDRRFGTLVVFTLWTASLLAAAPTCLAQAPDGTEDMQASCAADYMRLCAGMFPYGDEVRQCFATNQARLSKPCRDAITKYHRQQDHAGTE